MDYSLYLVTDRSLLPEGQVRRESVNQALVGGATVVQIREKKADTGGGKQFLEVAQQSKSLCDLYGVHLIINDHVDIALAVGAAGVHLGQSDMPIDIARKLMPTGTVIGISCNTVEEVRRAREANADYVGLGAVWDTQTKKLDKSPIGVRGLSDMLDALDGSDVRAVAIGGIKTTNLARLMHGSVSPTNRMLDGVAIVSDIVASPDPKKAAQTLKSIFSACRQSTLLPLARQPLRSRETILDKALEIMNAVRKLNPLVHQVCIEFLPHTFNFEVRLSKITNTVVSTQSANVTLAMGASPIMATAPEEMADLANISAALLINIGTLQSETLKGMLKAGHCANSARIPIVLDPVGVGASAFRKDSVNKLLDIWHPTVIKGNAGELAALAGSNEATSKGVDSQGQLQNPVQFVRDFARKERCVVALTGEIDFISDGVRVFALKNGDPLLARVTGSGCMLGSCIASYCAAANLLTKAGDFLSATIGAILMMTIASELAAKRATVNGPATFVPALIDEVAALGAESIMERARIEQIE
ncbi:thiamine biosynthetic bifunctional enzyme Thi4 [Roridomyces roridus]|uniref:Thiamine biosynthetic bifunctional enzyme Thi4 n=1 Tax=Roridomyces roridus TaxID=1738132 RepID=A0AAD7CFA5_9AGAR|nr:thiamine biosynthetic bifunctional enzyme Thi4 [Roridomyces roridus]